MKIAELVNKNYDKFSANDNRILKFIESHRTEAAEMSIEELASKCFVSRTTVLRFAKKLSFSGFSELKVHLKMELGDSYTAETGIANVAKVYSDIINSNFDKNYDDFFEIFDKAQNYYVYGSGLVQSMVAREIDRVFSSTLDKHFYVIDSNREAEYAEQLITADDVCLIVSITGESNHVLDFSKKLYLKGVPTLSITALQSNSLAHLANENLYISTHYIANHVGQCGYESTTGFFLLVELFFMKFLDYANRNHSEALKS
ncbi:MAG: MurR/RpiR family transcriptional regulator [Clostridiales Family XIII bacterium]|nr:MurR/RpiR family transcriptional regulator [Clostridiales Family XIII bacterium]